jgi:hypothetical protein
MTMFRHGKARTGILMAGCLAGGLVTIAQAQAATSRSGVISKFDGVDEIVQSCTSTTTFATVPQMTRAFNISGAASSVVVTFSGSASLFGQPFDTGFVRLTIDNVQQTPGEVPFIAADHSSTANSFTWQTRSLAVGAHTARIQWRTDLGSSFCLDARSLVVLHR